MRNRFSATWMLVLAAMVLNNLGCSQSDAPPLGQVTGQVTLDGKPLEGLIVIFKPTEGRAATATTDSKGSYQLEYSHGVKGCKTGANTVMMEWPLGSKNAKSLAERYTTKSELKADVKSGNNPLDFALKSDGTADGKSIVIPD